MRKYCNQCQAFVDHNHRCKRRLTKQQRDKYTKDTEAKRVRDSGAWKRKREEIKQRDKYLCKVCAAQGIYKTYSLEAHHIKSIEDDPSLAYDNDNIITLCSIHHKAADAGEITAKYLRSLITMTD